MIEFHFVNHSGFILTKDNIKLAYPWIDGSVFNTLEFIGRNTSRLLNTLSKSDYVWFSHEHPDHLIHLI